MVLSKLFGRRSRDEIAHKLFDTIVNQARTSFFYTDLQVADSVDGRFDMVTLHAYLVLRRLKADGVEAADLAQQLFDVMFDNFDENLREIGVGDIGIAGRIKKMASAFFGRVKAYDEGLDLPGNDGVMSALRRNLYRDVAVEDATLAVMAAYMRKQDTLLANQDSSALYAGKVEFLSPSTAANS